MAQVEIQTPAPPFSLQSYQGDTVSLSQFAGSHNVLLVFNRGFI